MKKRLVRITLEVVAETDRDAWEWGDAIARGLVDDIETSAGWMVAAQCLDVEDPYAICEKGSE